MKTSCPACATAFRVSPEQLSARGGKVRCGKCRVVFDANDYLLGERDLPQPTEAVQEVSPRAVPAQADGLSPGVDPEQTIAFFVSKEAESEREEVAEAVDGNSQQSAVQASDLITARETRGLPGYSKWMEGGIDTQQPAAGRLSHSPFLLATLILTLALVGQLAFHFRSPLAVGTPALRPLLETLSDLVGADIPLPRHPELISIETSDLQVDPKRTNLLSLQATLRNRATHEQAYPALQLSLTDTQDNVIARRVFLPGEYLSPNDLSPLIFAADAEISVRMWIEAKELAAAGYRLYAFYP